MIERPPLSELVFPNDGSLPKLKVCEMKFEQVTRDIRLFYRHHGEDPSAGASKTFGFWFYAAEWCSGAPGDGDIHRDIWTYDEIEVECWFHGVAYWDGVRHLHMGDPATKNEGYLYYADVRDIVLVFQALDALEQRLLDPERHQRT